MVGVIDAHRDAYGVEPICAVPPIAPSLYYELKARLDGTSTPRPRGLGPAWASATRRAECVNDFETQSARIYCRTSTVSRGVTGTSGMRWVGAALDAGGLIQTAFGTGGGAGGRRTNRSGWAV
jgi:hypothetical protein